MTDLEARIREEIGNFCGDTCAEHSAKALLGVLELHRPESVDYIDRDGQECSSTDCEVCGGNGSADSWPCPTPLAIAKGLGLLGEEED